MRTQISPGAGGRISSVHTQSTSSGAPNALKLAWRFSLITFLFYTLPRSFSSRKPNMGATNPREMALMRREILARGLNEIIHREDCEISAKTAVVNKRAVRCADFAAYFSG